MNLPFLKKLLFAGAAVICTIPLFGQFYQGMQNEFGKNRVQYRDFLWQYYRFEDYDVYFYEGGQELAGYTGKVAGEYINELEDLLDYSISDKVQFIVYRTQSEFKQSNIGLSLDTEYNIGGSTRIVGSKVFTYFEGDYNQFEKNLKEGIAHVIINQLLYGGNWREVVKNSTLLSLPEWYIDGLVQYSAGNWTPEMRSKVKSSIENDRYRIFNRLEGEEATLAGHALWRYVARVYGKSVIPNILYMSRISRNVESGFLFVLGLSLKTITEDFNQYYQAGYDQEREFKMPLPDDVLPVKSRKNRHYTQFQVSPNGKYAAYSSNQLGQYRVFFYDIEKDKRKKIIKREHRLARITDRSFPVIAWHPGSQSFSFVTEWRGKLMMNIYTVEDNKTQTFEIFTLDKVLDMDFSPNGQQMVFSGVTNGQTDLYLYYVIGNRQERLTNDIYDDLQPKFTMSGKQIIFTSNRTDDTLRNNIPTLDRTGNHDVFLYNLEPRSGILQRVTNTPDLHETQPAQYDSVRFTYIANYEGTRNRFIAQLDSAISRVDTTIHYRYFTRSRPITNYSSDILNYEVNTRYKNYTLTFFENGRYRFYTGTFNNDSILEASIQRSGRSGRSFSGEEEEIPPLPEKIISPEFVVPIDKNPGGIDITNYQFEGEQEYIYQRGTIQISEVGSEGEDTAETNVPVVEIPSPRNYNTNYSTDFVRFSVDNSYQNEFYQTFSGSQNLNPGISALSNLGASDLFEDHRILGGYRLAGNLDNNTYFIAYENLKKRLDKRIYGQRMSNRFLAGPWQVKALTYTGGYRVSWPFNEVVSVRGSFMYRYDQFILLASESISLREQNTEDHYAGIKGELVFDNTLNLGLNLFQGQRWKIWGEYYRDPSETETSFIVYGLDYRNYLKIHRSLIWANRLAFSSSVGTQRLVHFLGGVDNWMFPKEDNSLPIDPDQNYRFQTLGSPLRGFFYNARNGNSFAVINSEIRWPVFRYLLNRPIKSDFIANFQLIGFGDVGSAWTDLHPYSDESFFNNEEINSGPITIEIKSNREPIIYGYGFGLRSRLLGYFVRADWAWGVDDGIQMPRVFYLSLSLDF